MNFDYFLSFCIYFFILLCVGIVFHHKMKASSDFIVGNRSLNFWVIALSAHASDMSSWLFMGFPSAIFLLGLTQSWIAIGLLLGMYSNWQFIAIRLRTLTEKYNCYTLPTFFENRFNDTSGVIRICTALFSVIFLSCYLSAGLIGMGRLFESIFQMDYFVGLSIAMFVVILYTFIGGFITVAWTDMFQALFLLCMVILVPFTALSTLPNGIDSVIEAARIKGVSFSLFNDYSVESILTAVFLALSWGLGYFGQPHIVTKFMGINSPEKLRNSKYVGMAWMCIALSSATFIGFVGIAFFSQGLSSPELVFVEMVKTLFGPLVGGFILCGIVAASMSTMDSQILVSASVLSEDVIRHLFKKEPSEQFMLKVVRGAVLVISGIALVIAFYNNSSILDAVHFAWTGLGCAFGPLLLASLFSERINRNGAVSGLIVGGLLAAFWGRINPYVTDFPIPSMIPGFSLSLASIYLVSFISAPTPRKSIEG